MNNLNVSHKVIIYHDETKDVPGSNLKGHVLLFVPIKLIAKSETPLFGSSVQEYFPQELFFEKLAKYRAEFACNGKLHFTEISGKTWKKYDYAYHKAIDVTVDALRHKSPIYFQWPLNFKVAAIFYARPGNSQPSRSRAATGPSFRRSRSRCGSSPRRTAAS